MLFLYGNHQTIKLYFSRIRHAQIALGLPGPFANTSFPRLEYIIKGIKRSQAESGQILHPRLPITLPILHQLFKVWRESCDRDASMLQVACCLGFFKFLSAVEFTVPSWEKFETGAHLTISDVAVGSHNDPSILRIHIKKSRTDPFRKGVHIYLGCNTLTYAQ